MRRHISLKSNICTECVGVDMAGMSAEVRAHYSGRSVFLSGNRLLLVKRREDGNTEVSRSHSRTSIQSV